MIKISIIEDHAEFRTALESLFKLSSDFEFIASFSSANEAIKHLSGREDIVLLDIQMPGVSGIDALPVLKNKFPDLKIIMLTMFEDDTSIMKAILNGANGYLLKKSNPNQIIEAINECMQGGAPMTGSIANKVLNLFKRHIPNNQNNDYSLTKREFEILNLLIEGFDNQMIANKLFISIQTVRNHIRHIYEKLQVHSKSQAVVKAIREGLI